MEFERITKVSSRDKYGRVSGHFRVVLGTHLKFVVIN